MVVNDRRHVQVLVRIDAANDAARSVACLGHDSAPWVASSTGSTATECMDRTVM